MAGVTDYAVGQVPGECGQVVVLYVNDNPDKEGDFTTALCCFSRENRADGWVKVVGTDWDDPIEANIGSGGIGLALDDSEQTPLGSFPITRAIGRYELPEVQLPYHQIVPGDLWDVGHTYWSPAFGRGEETTYNTLITESVGQETENLNEFPSYNYAAFVDTNPSRRPGLGCAIFLHVEDDDGDTAGCVAIDEHIMKWILLWLDPGRTPYMTVLYGVAAP
ncbi:MAG: L,D-transpeptidase family protein [Mycobacterium kyogaense]|uniref:L,D-transpeptidase family protein n=1 Tax=Mycobacterium kyogaense TaxID=2212479 RepID=UPI002FF9D004